MRPAAARTFGEAEATRNRATVAAGTDYKALGAAYSDFDRAIGEITYPADVLPDVKALETADARLIADLQLALAGVRGQNFASQLARDDADQRSAETILRQDLLRR